MPEEVEIGPERPGVSKPGDRWRAALAAFRARRETRRAGRDEQAALLRLGEALAAAPAALGDGLRDALDEVARRESAVLATRAAVSATLHQDRADYAVVSPWTRPFVVARGLAARCVLRDRLRLALRERAAACRRLGVAALESRVAVPDVAAAAATAAREARARAVAAGGQSEALLAPFGGTVLPRPAHRVVREAAAFGKPLAREVRGRLVPRVPGLAGLAVGWWVASTFTDSRFSATLHSLGIGSGPRRAVSSDTLRAMSFWLPILAAALCSYLGGRLAALVRARYGPASPDASGEGRAQDGLTQADGALLRAPKGDRSAERNGRATSDAGHGA